MYRNKERKAIFFILLIIVLLDLLLLLMVFPKIPDNVSSWWHRGVAARSRNATILIIVDLAIFIILYRLFDKLFTKIDKQ